MGFEPMTSTTPVWCSTNWAMMPCWKQVKSDYDLYHMRIIILIYHRSCFSVSCCHVTTEKKKFTAFYSSYLVGYKEEFFLPIYCLWSFQASLINTVRSCFEVPSPCLYISPSSYRPISLITESPFWLGAPLSLPPFPSSRHPPPSTSHLPPPSLPPSLLEVEPLGVCDNMTWLLLEIKSGCFHAPRVKLK